MEFTPEDRILDRERESEWDSAELAYAENIRDTFRREVLALHNAGRSKDLCLACFNDARGAAYDGLRLIECLLKEIAQWRDGDRINGLRLYGHCLVLYNLGAIVADCRCILARHFTMGRIKAARLLKEPFLYPEPSDGTVQCESVFKHLAAHLMSCCVLLPERVLDSLPVGLGEELLDEAISRECVEMVTQWFSWYSDPDKLILRLQLEHNFALDNWRRDVALGFIDYYADAVQPPVYATIEDGPYLNLRLDGTTRTVRRTGCGDEVYLPPRQFQILKMLADAKGELVPNRKVDSLWRNTPTDVQKSRYAHISDMNKKVAPLGIKAKGDPIRGGYKLVEHQNGSDESNGEPQEDLSLN